MKNKKINKLLENMDVQSVRKMIFTPCKTKQELENWIKLFLGLELPNCTVDPRSTSNPMQNVWEVYEKAYKNDDPDFHTILSYAARDSMKCQVKGTKILDKNNGLVNIEDVKIGDTVWSGKAWRKVTDWIHDGIKPGLTLTLENGLSMTGSPIHRVWAWEPNKKPNWKALKDLKPEDVICFDIKSDYGEGQINQEEFDIGYLCGILTGDGCLTLMDKFSRVILSSADEKVIAFWKNFCKRRIGREPHLPKGNKYDWHLNSKEFVAYLKTLGLKNCYSWEKEIPFICLKSKSYLVGFISGVFDTDGSFSDKKCLLFSMTAFTLLKQMQVALAALGIPSRFKPATKLYKHQKHLVHFLTINQNAIPKLLSTGVRFQAKKAKELIFPTIESAHDGIPSEQLSLFTSKLRTKGGKWFKKGPRKPSLYKYKSKTRFKIKNLLDWAELHGELSNEELFYWRQVIITPWIKIKSVVSTQADFYDLTVEDDHSYWSNGFISHNTLSASIIELLFLFHLDRSLVHMAAIEAQAQKAQSYVKGFLRRPYLRDFTIGNSKRLTEVAKYKNIYNGMIASPDEFKKMDKREQDKYEENIQYAKIIVATMQGTNSDHANLICDEIDLISSRAAYEEAKMIPAPFEGKMPITLLTSSRKFAGGLVQEEIDEATTSGLQIRHWNIIDVASACPPERHLPDLPKVPIYYNEEFLQAISKDAFDLLDSEKQKKFQEEQGYNGCLSRCRLYAACRGALATRQKSTSPMLKDIVFVENLFKKVEVDTAKAQLLCLKPSSEGMIYGRLDHAKNVISADEMAETITGEKHFSLSKPALLNLLKTNERVRFYAGIDYGFTDAFAVVVGAVFGNKIFIIEAHEIEGLELQDMINFCEQKIKHYDADIFADTANPGYIKTFKRHKFKMRQWNKGPESVLEGITIVRTKIAPVIGETQLFFLKGDTGAEMAFKRMSAYRWETDAAGETIDRPKHDEASHVCDATRYFIMNVFANKSKALVNISMDDIASTPASNPLSPQNYLQTLIEEALAESPVTNEESFGQKGKIKWTF